MKILMKVGFISIINDRFYNIINDSGVYKQY